MRYSEPVYDDGGYEVNPDVPILSRKQLPDESYDDWRERITGERPRYDEAGHEMISDAMINNMGIGSKTRKSVPTPRNRAGYVYVLEVPNTPGLFKIGRTVDLDDRLRTFNVKLPFPVEYEHTVKSNDCYALETMLHRLFAGQRVSGEFFMLDAADLSILKSLTGD